MANPSPFLSSLRRRLFIVFLFLFPLILQLVINVAARALSAEGTTGPSPFTPRAAVLRYWNRKVPFNRTQPAFIVSKLSPLSAIDSAVFSSLAAGGPSALASRVSSLCSAANLLCLPSLPGTDHRSLSPSDFSGYENTNYTNYGTDLVGGVDSFKGYSGSPTTAVDSFRRYSRDSDGHNDSFASYSPDGNLVIDDFHSYATSATGGAGEFSVYAEGTNEPELRFTNYDADADGRNRAFKGYSSDANSGDESFAGYGRNGNGVVSEFTTYGNETNVVASSFNSYGRYANAANDSFLSYGFSGNVPDDTFHSYGDGGNAGSEGFASYRERTNGGADSFSSYAKGSNNGTANFLSYSTDSFDSVGASFKGYGEGSETHEITFTGYFQENNTFKAYAKSGINFKSYHNSSSSSDAAPAPMSSEKPAEHWRVEPGKFFRERELRSGNLMTMPDIRDKLPARSFLPRSIAGLIPFSAAGVQQAFEIPAETLLGKAVAGTMADCERPPSRGETKRCPTSAEELIDFAVEVLGSDVEARSTESAAGSGSDIMIGEVRGVNGGNITRSVSCHQSLFPYMVYYCHSVPRVRVYEAEILTVKSKERINRGVAICHLDTSDWSAGHGAFLALGPGPGKIEVCHWIFEGDMTWTVAD